MTAAVVAFAKALRSADSLPSLGSQWSKRDRLGKGMFSPYDPARLSTDLPESSLADFDLRPALHDPHQRSATPRPRRWPHRARLGAYPRARATDPSRVHQVWQVVVDQGGPLSPLRAPSLPVGLVLTFDPPFPHRCRTAASLVEFPSFSRSRTCKRASKSASLRPDASSTCSSRARPTSSA